MTELYDTSRVKGISAGEIWYGFSSIDEYQEIKGFGKLRLEKYILVIVM